MLNERSAEKAAKVVQKIVLGAENPIF